MGQSKKHILVVDDEPELRFLYQAKLNDMGYEVTLTSSAQEARDFLESHSNVDLILSDYMMPAMSGLDLYAFATGNCPDTPFLLITAFAEKGIVQKALSWGLVHILVKPVKSDTLADKIKTLIEESQQQAS